MSFDTPPRSRPRPRALDLFCGAGGVSVGLHRAGFDVVGVDLHPQPEYPFAFTQADALAVDLTGYDLIAASPPCQRWSTATKQSGRPEDHPDLIEPIRQRLQASGALYAIENVAGAPLQDAVMLCGSMFGLRVIRHRWFECNFPVEVPLHKHEGSLVTGEYVTVAGRGGVPAWTYKEREKRGMPRYPWGPEEWSLRNWQEAMGIDWMARDTLTQAIPPAYAQHIGAAALRALAKVRP